MFETLKKSFLSKTDKSNKGSIDEPIKELIDKINKNYQYFTTSSCSGRIALRVQPDNGVKKEVMFLYKTHTTANFSEIKKVLAVLPAEAVWFRFEPIILHVVCETVEDAQTLLDKAKRFFKHSGIMTLKQKIVVEIRGSEFIEAVVAQNREILVSDDYIERLVVEANKKMERNKKNIDGFKCLFD